MLARYKYQTHDKCSCYNSPSETTSHILKCPHPEATTLRQKELDATLAWMVKNAVTLSLATAIISNISKWSNHEPSHFPNNCNPLLYRAITLQLHVGWKNSSQDFGSENGYKSNINSSWTSLHQNHQNYSCLEHNTEYGR